MTGCGISTNNLGVIWYEKLLTSIISRRGTYIIKLWEIIKRSDSET